MSIQSRLQSRISKRRNTIRMIEEDVFELKNTRKVLDSIGYDRDEEPLMSVREGIFQGRKLVNELAEDQRLDKALKNIVTLTNANRRYYGLSDY